MSTLLTPIITQLELDRDRFKKLINGDVEDTINLEGREEYSIAGQVKNRIEDLAGDLVSAVADSELAKQNAESARDETQALLDEAQQASSDAFNYKSSTEGARDQATSILNDVMDLKSDTQDIKDSTETFRDQAESFRNSAEDLRDQSNAIRQETASLRNETSNIRSATSNIKNDTSEIYDDTLSIYNNVTSIRDHVEDLKDATELYEEAAQAARSDIQDMISGLDGGDMDIYEPLGVSPSILHINNRITVTSNDIVTFSPSAPRPISKNSVFVERYFDLQKLEDDDGDEEWVSVANQSGGDFSFEYNFQNEDDSEITYMRIVCDDSFAFIDAKDKVSYTTRRNESVEFILENDPLHYSVKSIDKPSITFNEWELDLSPFNSPSGETHDKTEYVVFSDIGQLMVSGEEDSSESLNIDPSTLPDGEYVIYVRYTGENVADPEDDPIYPASAWSDGYSVQWKNDRISDSVTINPALATAYTIEREQSPTISIISPDTEKFYEVRVLIEGDSGTVDFPSDIKWDDGSLPSYGDEWTLISLSWVNKWIGKVEAKK